MASPTDIPFPHGWERKYDAKSQRYYFVDHVFQKTQWDDPRVAYQAIWTQERLDMVKHLRELFKHPSEEKVREALIKARFVESEAAADLVSTGYTKSSVVVGPAVTNCEHADVRAVSAERTITTGQQVQFEMTSLGRSATPPQRSPKNLVQGASPRASSGGSRKERDHADVDHFMVMHMKALFPETTEEVLVDVLNQCGQNVDSASRELVNMGYSGRQNADIRLTQNTAKAGEMSKEKKKKEKEERGQNIRRLKQEFESILEEDISSTFENCGYDLYEARTLLRRREAELKLQSLETNQAPKDSVSAVAVTRDAESAVVAETTNVAGTRVRRESAPVAPADAVVKISVATKESTASHAQRNNEKAKKFQTMDDTSTARGQLSGGSLGYEVSKSSGASPSRPAVGQLLAKGPNASLRHGSDPNLRIGRRSLATGPDPSLRKGPNPQLQHAPGGHHVGPVLVR